MKENNEEQFVESLTQIFRLVVELKVNGYPIYMLDSELNKHVSIVRELIDD